MDLFGNMEQMLSFKNGDLIQWVLSWMDSVICFKPILFFRYELNFRELKNGQIDVINNP